MTKKIILVVLAFVVIVIGVGYLLPKQTEVKRSIIIEADAEAVFAQINNFQKSQQWSPWAEKDQDMQVSYQGPASGGRARMSWQSQNSQVGNGSQEIIESKPFEKIHIKLSLEGQDDAQAYFYLTALPENQTQLTWSFVRDHGNNPLKRYMGIMFHFWIGGDYEKGLANLKKLIETDEQNKEARLAEEKFENIIMVDENGKPVEMSTEEMKTLDIKQAQTIERVPEAVQKAFDESIRKREIEKKAQVLADKKASE